MGVVVCKRLRVEKKPCMFYFVWPSEFIASNANLHGSIVFSANNSVEICERCEQSPYYINLGKDASQGASTETRTKLFGYPNSGKRVPEHVIYIKDCYIVDDITGKKKMGF